MKQKECSNCKKTTFIYRNQTVDGVRLRLCKFCALSPEFNTVKKSNKKHTPIKQFSDKRSKRNTAYLEARKIFLMEEQNQFCPVMRKVNSTTVRTTEVHHTNGRENERLTDREYWLAVSREGHQWIHANPEIAREEGWLI